MAQRIIRLTENDIKRLIKATLNEVINYGGYDDDDEEDEILAKYDKQTALPKSKEYQGEFDQDEINADDEEFPEDDDVFPDEERFNDNDEFPEDNGDGDDDPDDEPQYPSRREEEPEEQHQEGDVIYYEDIPITYHDGNYEMEILHDEPVVIGKGEHLKNVKSFYDYMWDTIPYSQHQQYITNLERQGIATRDFGDMDFDNMVVGDNMNIDLSNSKMIVDCDKWQNS